MAPEPSGDELESLRAELKALREENEVLRLAEEKFEKLFAQAADSIFVIDLDDPDVPGRIVEANARACAIHGFTRDELVGLSIAELDTPEAAKKAPGRIARVRAGERLVFPVRHRRKDGSTFPIEVTVQALEIGGRRLAMAIDRAVSEIPAASPAPNRHEALDLLTEGLSHHFGNILQGIIGTLSIVRKAPRKADEEIAMALSACSRADTLVRKMGDLGGSSKKRRNPLHLETLLREILPLSLSGTKTSFDLSIGGDLPIVRANSTRIGQAVWNLVRNASEAMEGAGTVFVDVRGVELKEGDIPALHAGSYALVSIRDTGPGLAPGEAEKIFAPFYSKRKDSLGLGATAALWSVERHGGTIIASPGPETGTLLRLFLPASDR